MSRLNYGGQAVIEGVMMRGRKAFAVAVRAPNGKIVLHEAPLTARVYTSAWAQWPFVRGLSMLSDALVLGMRALIYSANVSVEDEQNARPPVTFQGPAIWGALLFSLATSIGLFFVLPSVVTSLLDPFITSDLLSNLIEGGIRLALLLGYLGLIGLLPDIRRVFQYHGAEHKTINAYEAGAELTPTSVKRFPLQHPRCGTGFLLIIVVLSILFFSMLGHPSILLRAAERVLLIPVIASIAYEWIKFGAAHMGNPLVYALLWPSLALQRLTTREPDESMLEVAILALQHVLVAEGLAAPATSANAEQQVVAAV